MPRLQDRQVKAQLEPLQKTLQGKKVRNTTPPNFLIARYPMLRQTEAVANMNFPLFADGAELEGGLTVSVSEPMPKGVTKKDITEAVIDICRLLDLQTYQYQKDRRKQRGLAPENSRSGAICITLSEWTKTFFAKDTISGSERKKARRILEYLDTTKTKVTDKEGKEFKFRFITILNEATDPKTNTTVYWIVVNEIFSNEIDGFGRLPQDYKMSLRNARKKVLEGMSKRKQIAAEDEDSKHSKCTKTDIEVLTYLALQDKRHKHTVTMEALLQRCFLMEEYTKRRRATEKKVLVAMKSAAAVLGWEVEPISSLNRGKTYIYKFECVCKEPQDELLQDESLLLGFADEQEKEKEQ